MILQSLEVIEDNSIDFVFSFDSLVHAEADGSLEAYPLAASSRKLRARRSRLSTIPAFGWASFAQFYRAYVDISQRPRLHSLLQRFGLLAAPHWRAPNQQTLTKVPGVRREKVSAVHWSRKDQLGCPTHDRLPLGVHQGQIPDDLRWNSIS